VQALRRRAPSDGAAFAEALDFIQKQLHAETLTVRELMEAMRPIDVQPGELLDHLAGIVERFHGATGIAAELVSDGAEITLPGSVCRELARVLQESLANVRRHASAAHVVVRVSSVDGTLLMVIDDDGHGFPFEGRLEHGELDASRRGPVVIRERVRALGGRMAIESAPGKGSRVEIRVPMTGQEPA
jgi:signal transduction histidine kinase